MLKTVMSSKQVKFLENVAPLVQEDFQDIVEPLPAPAELPNVNFELKPRVFALTPSTQIGSRRFQSPPNIIGNK